MQECTSQVCATQVCTSQAGKSAASYLKYDSFSRQGLIDQLLFEKYTQAQAEYGATKAGL